MDRAAARTHNAWLETSQAQPGVRLVNNNELESLQKAGLANPPGQPPITTIEQAQRYIRDNNIPIGPQYRGFAFPTDDAMRVDLSRIPAGPQRDAAERMLNLFGRENVERTIRGNNTPSIAGVRGAVAEVLDGRTPSVVTNPENYTAAAQDAHRASAAYTPQGAATRPQVDSLIAQVEQYQAALRSFGTEVPTPAQAAELAQRFPEAHALSGRAHDTFVGYRQANNTWMDPSQAVPYAHLPANIAVLDLDPVLATLRSAREEL